MESLWSSPPEKLVEDFCKLDSSNEKSFNVEEIVLCAISLLIPLSRKGSSRHCCIVQVLLKYSPGSWNTGWIDFSIPGTNGLSFKNKFPLIVKPFFLEINPKITFIIVDFPDPDSPMRAVIELEIIFKLIELIIFLLSNETESDFVSSKLRDKLQW